MDRCDIVRAAYERFNAEDFEGVLELCDPEFEFRELFGNEGPSRGRSEVLRRWTERFADLVIKVDIGEVVEVGETVVAAVCCQVYDRAYPPVRSYILVSDSFSFRGDRILRMESTLLNEPSDEVKALLKAAAT